MFFYKLETSLTLAFIRDIVNPILLGQELLRVIIDEVSLSDEMNWAKGLCLVAGIERRSFIVVLLLCL